MSRPHAQQGFALLIVMIIAATALAVTVSLTRLAGSSAQVASSEENRLLAANAARTGLERATAYALEVAKETGGDFDLVLDPDEEADCTDMSPSGSNEPFDFSQVDDSNFILRPLFMDAGADHVEWPALSGKWWRMVPHNGGAYLVRFEDDGDDDCSLAVAGTQTNWTSNHDDPPGYCYEGVWTTSDSPPGYDSAVNPVRDMNRSIWVISVGIHPGTNPETARFRITERRMLRNDQELTAAFVANHMNTSGSSSVTLQSDEATSRTNHAEMTGSANWSVCTSESAHWDPPGSTSSATCSTLPHSEVDIGSFSTPSVEDWNHTQWMNFGGECNFLIRNLGGFGGGDPEGLWWWHAAGRWGAGDANRCDDVSAFAAIPEPRRYTNTSGGNPDAREDPDDPGSCWVPLLVSPQGTPSAFDPCELHEAKTTAGTNIVPTPSSPYSNNSGGSGSEPVRWYPKGNVDPAPTAGDDCNGYYLRNLAVQPDLPDFLATCGGGVLMPNSTTYGPCPTCDGTDWGLHYQHVSGGAQFTLRATSGGNQYIPNGTYFYLGSWNVGAGVSNGTASGATDNWSGQPNMITLVMSGDLILSSGDDYAFGAAQDAPPTSFNALDEFPWPGLVVRNVQMNNGNLEVWGGLYVRSNVSLSGTASLTARGPVVIHNDVTAGGSTSLSWVYPTAFFTPPVVASPGLRMSYPLRF